MPQNNRGRIVLNVEQFDRLCEDRGWFSVRGRAEKIGVNPSILSRLTRHLTSPSLDVIDVIATVLDVPHRVLFYRES